MLTENPVANNCQAKAKPKPGQEPTDRPRLRFNRPSARPASLRRRAISCSTSFTSTRCRLYGFGSRSSRSSAIRPCRHKSSNAEAEIPIRRAASVIVKTSRSSTTTGRHSSYRCIKVAMPLSFPTP